MARGSSFDMLRKHRERSPSISLSVILGLDPRTHGKEGKAVLTIST